MMFGIYAPLRPTALQRFLELISETAAPQTRFLYPRAVLENHALDPFESAVARSPSRLAAKKTQELQELPVVLRVLLARITPAPAIPLPRPLIVRGSVPGICAARAALLGAH